MEARPVQAAVLDMNEGTLNLGVPSIVSLIEKTSNELGLTPPVETRVFDVRAQNEIPDLDFDFYVSSGGPGSPFDGVGSKWEAAYFKWMEGLWRVNTARASESRRPALFICHSFELLCRFFEFAEVTRRQSASFGVFPVHKTSAGATDHLLAPLRDPFWAADFRSWQVIQPSKRRLGELEGRILAREKERPHVDLERAVMGVRISEYLVGLQFHPEAAPEGMRHHFSKPEKRASVIEKHGEERLQQMLEHLDDPAHLVRTHRTIVPRFLRRAISYRLERVSDKTF